MAKANARTSKGHQNAIGGASKIQSARVPWKLLEEESDLTEEGEGNCAMLFEAMIT